MERKWDLQRDLQTSYGEKIEGLLHVQEFGGSTARALHGGNFSQVENFRDIGCEVMRNEYVIAILHT
ncbi:16106_t:CDS:2 [Funneliformis geosporum]|nr:16106_t:CDS:2 [Funneliformis geosporum]